MLLVSPYHLFIVSHQENLHEIIQISVKNTLSIGSLVTSTKVLDHLVRMKHIASDLRAPLNLLLLTLELSLLLLTLLQLDIIETRLQDSKCILPIVKLRTCLRILHHDSRWNMLHTHTGLDLVHILSAGTA